MRKLLAILAMVMVLGSALAIPVRAEADYTINAHLWTDNIPVNGDYYQYYWENDGAVAVNWQLYRLPDGLLMASEWSVYGQGNYSWQVPPGYTYRLYAVAPTYMNMRMTGPPPVIEVPNYTYTYREFYATSGGSSALSAYSVWDGHGYAYYTHDALWQSQPFERTVKVDPAGETWQMFSFSTGVDTAPGSRGIYSGEKWSIFVGDYYGPAYPWAFVFTSPPFQFDMWSWYQPGWKVINFGIYVNKNIPWPESTAEWDMFFWDGWGHQTITKLHVVIHILND